MQNPRSTRESAQGAEILCERCYELRLSAFDFAAAATAYIPKAI